MGRLFLAALLMVGLTSEASAQIRTYREDAAHADGDPGIFPLAVRRAVGSGLCGSDGDYCALQVDANGALHVVFPTAGLVVDTELPAAAVLTDNFANPTAPAVGAFAMIWDGATWDRWTGAISGTIACSNCSGSGASDVDDSSFTLGTDSVAPAGFLADETTPDSVDEGDVGLARMSLNRNAYTQIRDGLGNERGMSVTAANAAKVDGSSVTQPVSVAALPLPTGASTLAEQQTQTTSLQLLDDAVSTTAAAVPAKGVQATGTDGTNARALKTDAGGELQIDVLSSALPTGAATETSAAAAATSLAIMDDWDETDRLKVNPIVGQAGVQGGAGAVSATTLRVAIATDANAVDRTAVAAANSTGSCVTVDGTNDTILASFATRRGATIINNGSVTVFMKLGATATTSSFPLDPKGAYNLYGPAIYTGIIDGITASGSASVCVVEF